MQWMPTPMLLTITSADISPVWIDFSRMRYYTERPIAELPDTPGGVTLYAQPIPPGETPYPWVDWRPAAALLWQIGGLAFGGERAAWLRPGDRYHLERWPNITELPHTQDETRMVAALAEGYLTAQEIALVTGNTTESATRVLNMLSLLGVLAAERGPIAPPSELTPRAGNISHVVLVVGPMGSGKTTAITSLSDIETVRTEALNTDRAQFDKATTTVALDYGEMTLDRSGKVRLYGLPGQRRFNFMWSVLKQRAVGLFVLLNGDADDPIADLDEYLSEFREVHEAGKGVVVGISRGERAGAPGLDAYQQAIAERFPGLRAPVLSVDPRERDQLTTLITTLAAGIEARAALGA